MKSNATEFRFASSIGTYDNWRDKVEKGIPLYKVIYNSYPIFEAHKNQLSLLNKKELEIVIRAYTRDHIISKILIAFQEKSFTDLEIDSKLLGIQALENLGTKAIKSREKALEILKSN